MYSNIYDIHDDTASKNSFWSLFKSLMNIYRLHTEPKRTYIEIVGKLHVLSKRFYKFVHLDFKWERAEVVEFNLKKYKCTY